MLPVAGTGFLHHLFFEHSLILKIASIFYPHDYKSTIWIHVSSFLPDV